MITPGEVEAYSPGGRFVLPGGLFHHGTRMREVVLRPPTGREEELIGDASHPDSIASAIITVLSRCIERIGTLADVTPDIVRELLVGDKDYLVLKLRQITTGDRVDAILVCPSAQCGEKIDMDFNLSQVPIHQGNVSSHVVTVSLEGQQENEGGGGDKQHQVKFRLPNTGDQEALAPLIVQNETSAENALLGRCIQEIDGSAKADAVDVSKLPPWMRMKLEETMAELAPHVDFELEATCPECGQAFSFPFHISQFFLDEIRVSLDELYQEVHFLAFYYKWSESEILSMTRQKRQKYLALLEAQLGRDMQACA